MATLSQRRRGVTPVGPAHITTGQSTRSGSSVDDAVDRFRFEVNRTVDRVQVHADADRRVRPAAALARRTR